MSLDFCSDEFCPAEPPDGGPLNLVVRRGIEMNLLEAVAKWYGCPYGLKKCREGCENYFMIDPRTYDEKGQGPGPKGQRTLCSLFDDLDQQIMERTNDPRLKEESEIED